MERLLTVMLILVLAFIVPVSIPMATIPSLALAQTPAATTSSAGKIASPINDPIKTDTGYISGTILGDPSIQVHTYRGIPYAASPVGELRWKPPQPVTSWSRIRECTSFCNKAWAPGYSKSPSDFSEDCLYLNVYTPAKTATEKLPVMVYFHGGGYGAGSGNDYLTNTLSLTERGVVLITVNTRLGALGLLAHPLLNAESSDGESGNYLVLDMISSLQWIQRNIAAFGGNPNNVTIFGESGGGAKVTVLLSSPAAKGLFHRAIIQSGADDGYFGSAAGSDPFEKQLTKGERFFKMLGVDKEPNPLAAARALPPEKLVDVDAKIDSEVNYFAEGPRPSRLESMTSFGISWGTKVVPDKPADVFNAGKQNLVPLMLMANLGEIADPGAQLGVIKPYLTMLKANAKAGSNGYAVIFDQVPTGWKDKGMMSVHTSELAYLFGFVDNPTSPVWFKGFSAPPFQDKLGNAKAEDFGLTDKDKMVETDIIAVWTHFARTGNPSVSGLINVPAWNESTDQYLYFSGDEPNGVCIKTGFSQLLFGF